MVVFTLVKSLVAANQFKEVIKEANNSIQTTGQECIAGHKRPKHDVKSIQNNTKAATSCKFYAS
jgi:hypothetical protein